MKADPKRRSTRGPTWMRQGRPVDANKFFFRGMSVTSAIKQARNTVADRLDKEVFPQIVAEHKAAEAKDLGKLSDKELIADFRRRAENTGR